jgi:hypothetical protein
MPERETRDFNVCLPMIRKAVSEPYWWLVLGVDFGVMFL